MSLQITKHAVITAKKRMGWNDNKIKKMAKKALRDGATHSETGGGLHCYLDGKFLSQRKADNMRIHGDVLYIFAHETLLTLYTIPTEYQSDLQRMWQSRKSRAMQEIMDTMRETSQEIIRSTTDHVKSKISQHTSNYKEKVVVVNGIIEDLREWEERIVWEQYNKE